jgi:hypothetical protein
LVVIELGAGIHIPTARHFGQRLSEPLIRINPTASELGAAKGVSLPLGALEALQKIDRAMRVKD